jgi:hypothetical protein
MANLFTTDDLNLKVHLEFQKKQYELLQKMKQQWENEWKDGDLYYEPKPKGPPAGYRIINR